MTATATVQRIREVAKAYRFLNLVVGVAGLCWFLLMVFSQIEPEGSPRHGMTLSFLGILAAHLTLPLATYRLASSLEIGVPILWAVFSLFGCVGLLVVVVIANQAPKWFQKQGLKVGLLGPTEESMAALEAGQIQPPATR